MKRTRASTPPLPPPAAPVHSSKPDPMAWKHALKLAGGDPKRLQPLPDGSVVVRNPRYAVT